MAKVKGLNDSKDIYHADFFKKMRRRKKKKKEEKEVPSWLSG